jgi:hypothetical protein
VALQFAATRAGDAFWYENQFAGEPDLLALLSESSMADVIARTSGIEHVYRDAFLAHDRLGGTDEDDDLRGSRDRDLLIGFDGDDLLVGRGGNDDLFGGTGEDRLRGGNGEDVLKGGEDEDRLNGGRGADTLEGGEGNDLLIGAWGSDDLTGGAGADEFRFRKTDMESGDTDTISDLSFEDDDQIVFAGQRGIFDGATGNGRIESTRELAAVVEVLQSDDKAATSAVSDNGALRLEFGNGYALSLEGYAALADVAFDPAKAFWLETSSLKRGAPEGADGVALVGLTDDRIVFDIGGINVTVDGTEATGILDGAARAPRLWDSKSSFSTVSAEKAHFFAGGVLSDIVGWISFGEKDAARLLDAALAGDDRLELIGIDDDSFALRIENARRDTVNTVLFTDAEDAIARSDVEAAFLTDEFWF